MMLSLTKFAANNGIKKKKLGSEDMQQSGTGY